MDLQWLIPLGTFLGVLGGGVAWLINRADKKRDKQEADLIQTLRDRIEELTRKLRWWERRDNRRTRAGDKWREQLVKNHIEPDPEEWPEDEDEQ